MTKLTPSECTYTLGPGEDFEGEGIMTHVMIFPKDKNHPLSDNLRFEDLVNLPEYFSYADAENYWMVEEPLDQVRADMDALGYTFEESDSN